MIGLLQVGLSLNSWLITILKSAGAQNIVGLLIYSPKRAELFGPLGVTNIRTFVDPQNPKRVAVMMDVPDIDALAATMKSKAASEAMAFDGVVPESLVILVEAKK